MAWPPPFLTVNNYPEMLTKLSIYTTAVAAVCVSVLRAYAPPVKDISDFIDKTVPAEWVDFLKFLPSIFGVIVLAGAIGILANVVKLHDRLSDVLQIRREFGLHYLLYPLAAGSGASLSAAQFDRIRQQQRALTQDTFYKYASSSQPQIDKHEVTSALTNWSWLWVCLEATFLGLATAVILAVYAEWHVVGVILLICTGFVLLMRFLSLQCAVHAEAQIGQILRDPNRRAAVAAVFNAL